MCIGADSYANCGKHKIIAQGTWNGDQMSFLLVQAAFTFFSIFIRSQPAYFLPFSLLSVQCSIC